MSHWLEKYQIPPRYCFYSIDNIKPNDELDNIEHEYSCMKLHCLSKQYQDFTIKQI